MRKQPTITQLEARLLTLAEQVKELAEHLQLARGTHREIKIDPNVLPVADVYQAVRALIAERPMSHQDVVAAIPGVNENRIKNILYQMKQREPDVVNFGSSARALYFRPNQRVVERLEAAVAELDKVGR